MMARTHAAIFQGSQTGVSRRHCLCRSGDSSRHRPALALHSMRDRRFTVCLPEKQRFRCVLKNDVEKQSISAILEYTRFFELPLPSVASHVKETAMLQAINGTLRQTNLPNESEE